MKLLFASLGWLALSVGVVGIFVPFVPTTPLVLLAGVLWTRSSPRLHAWLLRQPCLGRCIREYRERRTIPLRARLLMLGSVWLSMGYCIFGLLRPFPWAQATMGVVAIGISACIVRLGRGVLKMTKCGPPERSAWTVKSSAAIPDNVPRR